MISFIYLAPLLLYFPRFVQGVETQALLMTGVALLGLLFGRNSRSRLSFLGLSLTVLIWISVKIIIDGELGRAVALVQLLIGPLALFGALALKAPPPSRSTMAGITLYFALCAMLEILAPGTYETLASGLLSRASVADGHRGVSLLTPEPTYAAISIVYFLVLAWWSGKHWGFRHRWVEPTLALCLLLTGSTYVGLLLLALAFVHWPRLLSMTAAVVIIGIPFLGVVALENDESIRAVVAVSRLLSSDFTALLPSLSIIDSSLGSRLTTNTASFLTPLHTPLGLGLDCGAVPRAFGAAGFDFALSNPVLQTVMDEGCLKPQSYAATAALGLGVFSLVFFFVIVIMCRYARGGGRRALWLSPLALAFIVLVVQGQLTNPIPWLLVFFALNGCQERAKHLIRSAQARHTLPSMT